MTANGPQRLRPIACGKLSIASLNCYLAPSKPQRAQRAQKIVGETLPRWHRDGIDIVGLQESFDSSFKHSNFSKKSSYPHLWLEDSRARPWHYTHSGLAIASKHPILSREFRGFGDKRWWVRFANTGLQRAEIDHPELGAITVANTHLQSSFHPTDPNQYSDARLAQLQRDVVPMLQMDLPHIGPAAGHSQFDSGLVVMLGDLNHHTQDIHTGKPTPEYEFITQRMGLADATSIIGHHRNLREDALFSFGPEILFAEKPYDKGPKLLYDRIHIGNRFSNRIVVVNLGSSTIELEDIGLSDHRGVKMVLDMTIYDLGAQAFLNSAQRVFFVESEEQEMLVASSRRMAA
jgi:hypothetical protein